MKSGIYLGKNSIEIRETDIPTVGDNDVLIKNIYSSICGTDVAVYNHGPNTGHKIDVDGEFGHETVSKVVRIGKNVKDFFVGERVYPYPRFVKKDTRRAGTIGGFSEYILVENAVKNYSLYNIDDRISDRLACLIEPFTVGCRAARCGMVANGTDENGQKTYVKGQSAVVFGCGTIGFAAAVALKYFGMDKVMICDLSDFRLKIAKKLGFEVCNMASEDFAEKSKEFFGMAKSLTGKTANIDCWIDAAGAESVLNLFMEQGKIESRFVTVAVNNAIRNLDFLHITYAQKSIIGSGGYLPEDVIDVEKIMAANPKLESIITHEFSIDELEKAIQTASDTNICGNVVIKF